jgi:hypothetical protein
MGRIRRASLSLVGSAVLSMTAAFAQVPAPPAPGPVPPAILSAKNIFVSNAGADSGLFPEPFSGDPNRAYAEFYSMLKAEHQYELVSDPSQADLVLELQLTAPNGPTNANKQNGASDPLPMFRLTIYDRKTHYVLWELTESIEAALLQKTHDRNFDDALTDILLDFEALSGKAPPPARVH